TPYFVTREPETAQVPLDPTSLPLGSQIRDDVVERLVERHLREVLPVVANRNRATELEVATLYGMLAQQGPEERALPHPVLADHAQHVRATQGSAEPRDQSAVSDPHTHVPSRHDLISAPLGHFEPERHRVVGTDHLGETRQAVEALAPALGLLAVL